MASPTYPLVHPVLEIWAPFHLAYNENVAYATPSQNTTHLHNPTQAGNDTHSDPPEHRLMMDLKFYVDVAGTRGWPAASI